MFWSAEIEKKTKPKQPTKKPNKPKANWAVSQQCLNKKL